MLLSQIKQDSTIALNYLERLVNNGSPSGFSEKNTASKETNPFTSEGYYICRLTGADKVENYGNVPECFFKTNAILCHPDWKRAIPSDVGFEVEEQLVIPTSSVRTIKMNGLDYYIKLSYPGVIGRLARDLDEQHILSSIQINGIMQGLTNNSKMPDSFAFLPESGGQLFIKGDFKTGCVFRQSKPIGKNAGSISYIIPAFSLFGVDRKNPQDDFLLLQILKEKKQPEQFLFSQIIKPLIEIYFTCVLEEGLSAELHSQNVLLGFNNTDDVVAIILRDLESVDKDNTIRRQLGKSEFLTTFKSIEEGRDYNYKIKHSFMYDHKLGEYLIEELINCAQKGGFIESAKIINKIRSFVNEKYGNVIKDFFPEDGLWYKFEDVEIDRNSSMRPYKKLTHPILR